MQSGPYTQCVACRKRIKNGEAYVHNARALCETCYMDARTTRARKTHWQYLKSIKTEYLRPAADDMKIDS